MAALWKPIFLGWMMKKLWLAAALAIGVSLGGWSLPKAEAGHGHCGNNGYGSHYHHRYGGGGYYGPYRSYSSGYVAPRVYRGIYSGGYAPYIGGGPSFYGSGYRGFGYSNFGYGGLGYGGIGYGGMGYGPGFSVSGFRAGF
jgi:hypothetical protein